jgi:hypothetical protein
MLALRIESSTAELIDQDIAIDGRHPLKLIDVPKARMQIALDKILQMEPQRRAAASTRSPRKTVLGLTAIVSQSTVPPLIARRRRSSLRDGDEVDAMFLCYCRHQWIDHRRLR